MSFDSVFDSKLNTEHTKVLHNIEEMRAYKRVVGQAVSLLPAPDFVNFTVGRPYVTCGWRIAGSTWDDVRASFFLGHEPQFDGDRVTPGVTISPGFDGTFRQDDSTLYAHLGISDKEAIASNVLARLNASRAPPGPRPLTEY